MKQLIIDIDCDLLNRIREAKSVPDMCGTDIVNAINAIKSGVPTYERQTGEWIVTQEGRWLYPICSLCGGKQDVKSNYCPDCGARMKGKNNGN